MAKSIGLITATILITPHVLDVSRALYCDFLLVMQYMMLNSKAWCSLNLSYLKSQLGSGSCC